MSTDSPKTDSREEYILLNDCSQVGYQDSIEVPKDTGIYSRCNGKQHDKVEENEACKRETRLVGFFSLFRYCSVGEKAVLIIASLTAVMNGFVLPALNTIYGIAVDKIIQFSRETSAQNCSANYTPVCYEITEDFLEKMKQPCIWLACIAIFCLISSHLSTIIFNLTATNQAFKIRCLFMASVLKQDVGWYDTQQTGDFAHKITGDLTVFQDGIGDKVGICIRCISTAVVGAACGIYYGWKLALVTLAFSPVPICAMAIMTQKQATAAREEMKAYSTAGAVAEEVLSAIRTVVAFGGERKEVERYGRSLSPAMKKGIRRGLITGIGNAIGYSSLFVFYAIGFSYGIHLFLEDWGQEKPTYTAGILVNVKYFCKTDQM